MQVQTILHPTDHSESSAAALRYAAALAHDYGARLLLLDVSGTDADPLPAPAPVEPRPAGRVILEYLVAQDDPVAASLRAAREYRCDLIILGSQGDASWERWLWGSRAEQIIRQAPCPVLVVRAPMAPRPGPQTAATVAAEH